LQIFAVFPNAALAVTPSILEFLTFDDCENGLPFSIINTTDSDVIINDITETGSVFSWYLDNFSLNLPHSLSAGEQIDLLVKVAFPTEPTEEILTDYIYIDSELGMQSVTLFFDDALLVGAGETPQLFTTEFYGNSPNPFNPSTVFKFSLSADAKVSLNVYNIKGQLVKTLVNNKLDAGLHSVVWNGRENNGKAASSGIYFSIMGVDDREMDYTSVKKIILLK